MEQKSILAGSARLGSLCSIWSWISNNAGDYNKYEYIDFEESSKKVEARLDSSPTSDDGDLCSPVDSSLMALSTASVSTQKKRRTMQLQGFIGKQEVLILVDSGSVSSFISESVVQQLSHPEIFEFQDVIKIKNKTTIF